MLQHEKINYQHDNESWGSCIFGFVISETYHTGKAKQDFSEIRKVGEQLLNMVEAAIEQPKYLLKANALMKIWVGLLRRR